MSLAPLLEASHRIDRAHDETAELRPVADDTPTIILTAWSTPEPLGLLADSFPESLLLGEPRHRAASRPRHRRPVLWRTRALVVVAVTSIVAGLLLGRAW